MPRLKRIPLAFKNLTYDVRRMAVAVGGIGFAVLLMFMQTGFQYALLDSTVKVIDELQADLIIVNAAQYALPARQRFSRTRIATARECPGVAGVYPIYIEKPLAVLKRPGHKGYPIRVLAFDSSDPVFALPLVQRLAKRLDAPYAAMIDDRSKSKYGIPAHDPEKLLAVEAELAGRRIRFIGAFSLGTDFANDGNLIMTTHNFERYFPLRARGADPLSVVDMGVVQLKPGADPKHVMRCLKAVLPDDVAVYTKQGFRQTERTFWSESTPVGYIFGVGTALGFLVGVIICYQIIFASISSHLPEFATLKAMGYRDRYFVGLVASEAVYLSVLGFVPGLLASWALYAMLAHGTGLLMVMTPGRAAIVYGFTLLMCMTSGVLAMRKVLAADPAELF